MTVKSISRPARSLAFLTTVLATSACGAEPGQTVAVAVADTLDSGVVVMNTPAEGLWATSGRWSLVADLTIGSADAAGREIFGRIGAVAVDSGGRIWIVDQSVPDVRVFAPDGAFLRTVGRSGQGPGEFRLPSGMHVSPAGTLWVEDGQLRRIEIFDTAGVRAAGVPTGDRGVRTIAPESAWPAEDTLYRALPRRDGGRTYTLDNGVAMTLGAGKDVVRYHWSGTELVPIDTVPLPEVPHAPYVVTTRVVDGRNMPGTGPMPHADPGTLKLGPRGNLWITAGGGVYSIRQQGLSGDTVRIINRAFAPVPLPDSTRDRVRQMVTRGTLLGEGSPPESFRAIHAIYPAPDGTLWVRRQVGIQSYTYEVFDSEGLFLGEPTFDPTIDMGLFRLQVVTPHALYGVTRDDLGVERVVRLRIEKPAAERD